MNPFVRLFVDVGPLAAFFVAYARAGIMTATAAFMVATVIALAIGYLLERRVARMPLVSGVVVMLFGGLTLVLEDETFIKLKPTIVYLVFAGTLAGGLAAGRYLLRSLLEVAFRLNDEGWRRLSVRWAFFFLAMAALNEAVWRTLSTDAWVTLKVFGFLPLTLLFAAAQIPLIRRTMVREPAERTGIDEAGQPGS
ncbi:MAG: septation protein A [Alphaproteobacteria bacterium]